jgi:hypothetical protein
MKFTNLLKSLIVENSRFKLLYDKLVQQTEKDKKEGKKIPFEILKALIFADPDTKIPRGMEGDIDTLTPEQMENVKVGKYTQWLLKSFIAPTSATITAEVGTPEYKKQLKNFRDLFLEDLYKTTTDLKKFEKYKGRLPEDSRDINKLTPETLFDLVKDFSLEKVKASKEEKKQAATTYSHPGGDIVFKGPNWTVIKIERQDKLGKDAACFYGGQHEYDKGESRWCTSSPGLTYFERYIKDGPLYVILPNDAEQRGQVSQLPVDRYQFHFPSNQFMDRHDHNQDLVKLLSPGGKLAEIADYLKPEFAKGFKTQGGKKVEINIPDSSAGKFIAIYGPKELFDNLPDDVEHLLIQNRSDRNLGWKSDVLMGIGRFNNLEALMLKNCVDEVPDTLCNCNQLTLLALPNNPNLKSIPACVGDFENLAFINLKDSNKNVHIPEELKSKLDDQGDGFYYIM